MQIQKPNLKWRGALTPLYLPGVDAVAAHHMGNSIWGLQEVHEYHKNGNGWLGIGYNYFIDFNGVVSECRGLNEGAAVLSHNSHIISIGFQGDYDGANKVMPDAQFVAGVELIQYLRSLIPSIKTVAGHKTWNNTTCPGQYFPLAQMVNKSIGGSYTVLIKRGDTGSEVSNLQGKLNKLGYGLVVDGDFGPATEIAVKSFQRGNNLDADGIVGPATLAALEQAIKNMEAPQPSAPAELTVEAALQIMVDNGIINTPDHWQKAAEVVKYLDQLIINVAKKLM